MIAEIKTAYDAATTALKLAKTIQTISKDVEINSVVIELQQSILDLQAGIFATQATIEELSRAKSEIEAKLKTKKEWSNQKKRYFLKEFTPGIVAYALNPNDKSGEPEHYLCPNCFQKDEKRFLQRLNPNQLNFRCNSCQFEIRSEVGMASYVKVHRPGKMSFL